MIDFAEARVADIRVNDQGTVVALHCLTDAAREWIHDNVAADGWQWLGDSTLVVDHRFAHAVLTGATHAGLEVVG